MKFASMTHCILCRACCLFYLIFYYVFVWGKLASLLILSRRFCRFLLMTMIENRCVSCGSKISAILDILPLWPVINNPVIYRFTRVVFGLTSTPFLLDANLQHHLSKYFSIVDITFCIEKLMRDLYVDGSTNSFDEVHECLQFFEVSKACLAAANFKLRKWATNNSDLRNVIDNASHTDKEQGNSKNETIRKVLGLN